MSSRADLAAGDVLEAFTATVSYRLEPGGWGSRFPVVLDHLLAGRLAPPQVEAALAELATIGAELRALPPERVVASLQDRRRRDDPHPRVRTGSATAYHAFVAFDGRPLVEALREKVLEARAGGGPVALATAEAGSLREAAGLIAGGLVWGIVGYTHFPGWVLVPHGAGRAGHGPALWSLGVVFVVAGAAKLLARARPDVSVALRRHGLLTLVVSLSLVAGLFALTWR